MKTTRGSLVFFLLITLVTSNPVMKYSFCLQSKPECVPTLFALDSPFEFGNIKSGVVYLERNRGELGPMSLSCTFHEPLRWILTESFATQSNSISNNVATNGSHLLYYYHIQVNTVQPGLIRCESYNNSNLAAEIYMAWNNNSEDYYSGFSGRELHHFLITSPKRSRLLIVPCTAKSFGEGFDASTIRLMKIRRNEMLISKVTPNCFSCFPHDKRDEANCAISCPYHISEKLWNDTQQPLGVNNTANQWLDCIRDSKCAFETVTKLTKFKKKDCNYDSEITCSDYVSAIASYPRSCETSSSWRNFISIEACVAESIAQSVDSAEVDYDPRVGFRLKTERDLDAVYICNYSKSHEVVYMSPYSPTKQIKARLEVTDNSNGSLNGIHCIVPKKWVKVTEMTASSCFTLFECETKLESYLNNEIVGEKGLRGKNKDVYGREMNKIGPKLFGYRSAGKTIQNPPRSGVVNCRAPYKLHIGYISQLQYFFFGLDFKLYFLSKRFPIGAVISLEKVQIDLTTSDENQIEVECTVANFIVFPNFEFQIEYSNGTIQETERLTGLNKRQFSNSMSTTHRLKKSTDDEASIVSITCRAPFRNSREEAEATLTIEPTGTTALPEADSSSTADSTSSQIYLPVILTVAIGIILLLASIACAIYGFRKYKKSTELRQLTLQEINEFFNGNVALATGSTTEVNVDSIGFPECLQIPAVELKMHSQEVLGEGEFGRCVSGHFHDQKVAVKTTKASMDVEAFKQFLREVKIIAYLGKHENVIEFLGAVVDQLKHRKCFAVVEPSPYGDLLSYLRQNAKEHLSNVNLYANLPHGEPLESSQSTKLESNHLSYFCEQIASGMEFVVGKRVIHGDLAARNVLVFPEYVVKITDFGLSRKLYAATNYTKKNSTPLPWRWMAIESLKCMEFSPMTDMWAFGVTAWEIFSCGEVPYPGLVYSHDFINEVEQGQRLPRPKNASEEIYQFMKLTWDRIPSARPSFQDAKTFFRRRLAGRVQRQDLHGWPVTIKHSC